MIVDSESEEESEPTSMDLEMINDEKTEESAHFDHLSIHQTLQNKDDLERNENLEWLLPSLRKIPEKSTTERPKTSTKAKTQRKRLRERKLRLQRMKAAKKAKILFS